MLLDSSLAEFLLEADIGELWVFVGGVERSQPPSLIQAIIHLLSLTPSLPLIRPSAASFVIYPKYPQTNRSGYSLHHRLGIDRSCIQLLVLGDACTDWLTLFLKLISNDLFTGCSALGIIFRDGSIRWYAVGTLIERTITLRSFCQ